MQCSAVPFRNYYYYRHTSSPETPTHFYTVFRLRFRLLTPLHSPLDPADSHGRCSMSLFLYGEELAGYPLGCYGSSPKRTWKGCASQRRLDGVCSPDRVGKRQVA
ncbi:hypothetical protein JB92DRAFT_2981675 [Gautieria morchelliformis]|nr:hypothetical protein JB92DRAFT_2981675 [Gautieria morchelliformis]